MWIRSQDKRTLAYIRLFEMVYGYSNPPYKIRGYSDDWAITNNSHIDLGYYSTKEKAIKVLDQIVEEINYGDLQNVFQMPQDEEVENE